MYDSIPIKFWNSDRKQSSSWLGVGVARLQRGTRKLWGMKDTFIILIVVTDWCKHMTKLIKLYTLSMCDLLNVNYTLDFFFLIKSGTHSCIKILQWLSVLQQQKVCYKLYQHDKGSSFK